MATSTIKNPNIIGGINGKVVTVAKSSSVTFNVTAPLQLFMIVDGNESGLKGAYVINENSTYAFSVGTILSASSVSITADATNHTITIQNTSTGSSLVLMLFYMNGRID
ncbi:MAG: hypothetical protein IJI83_05235 [Oscillospiraceae bacterium]|nr:hypothetical protein [Oscillospiraceae bacterium]